VRAKRTDRTQFSDIRAGVNPFLVISTTATTNEHLFISIKTTNFVFEGERIVASAVAPT
jgi:hypothetical protein